MALHKAGEHTSAELAELFGVARSTVYRGHRTSRRPGMTPEGPPTGDPAAWPDSSGAEVARTAAVMRSTVRQFGAPRPGCMLSRQSHAATHRSHGYALWATRCRGRQTPPPSAPPDWHHPASTTRTARHRPPTSPSSDNDALVVRLSHLARDDVEATLQAITTSNARRCDMAK